MRSSTWATLRNRRGAPPVPNEPLFPNAYPRGGKVAILCEGDVVGYEAKLLKQWADSVSPGGRLVDVWPCGTSEALFGVADAIGRTVRCVVIEDRDFRDSSEADEACTKIKKDRAERNLAILDWRCWRRNEVENYFLDDDVLLPVMTGAFGCTDAEARDAVANAIRLLVPFQAMHAAFHKVRFLWDEADPAMLLGPTRPRWRPDGLEPVDISQVEKNLQERLVRWQTSVYKDGALREPWKGDAFLTEFRRLVAKWGTPDVGSAVWREVWAGKEVLKLVRQQLCTLRPGWWSADPAKAQSVVWHAMKNNRVRDAHDREVERALLPNLVGRFCQLILAPGTDARNAEFDELAQVVAS